MAKDFITRQASDNLFFRSNYHSSIWLAIILSILCSLLVLFIFYQDLTAPEPDYFATTTAGEIIPIAAYDEVR